MGLETATTLAGLNQAWPLGTDQRSQGDDHIRLVKKVVQGDALSKAAGGTVAGPVTLAGTTTIAGASPRLQFEETDQVDPVGQFRFYGAAGVFYLQHSTTAAWGGTPATIWRYEPAQGVVAFDKSVVVNGNQVVTGTAQIDSVYIGADQTGGVSSRTVSAASGGALILRSGQSANPLIEVRGADNSFAARFDIAGTAMGGTTTVVTREKGDLRYAAKTALFAALAALSDGATVPELRDALLAALDAAPDAVA